MLRNNALKINSFFIVFISCIMITLNTYAIPIHIEADDLPLKITSKEYDVLSGLEFYRHEDSLRNDKATQQYTEDILENFIQNIQSHN